LEAVVLHCADFRGGVWGQWEWGEYDERSFIGCGRAKGIVGICQRRENVKVKGHNCARGLHRTKYLSAVWVGGQVWFLGFWGWVAGFALIKRFFSFGRAWIYFFGIQKNLNSKRLY
jgi:hypothetical protein